MLVIIENVKMVPALISCTREIEELKYMNYFPHLLRVL